MSRVPMVRHLHSYWIEHNIDASKILKINTTPYLAREGLLVPVSRSRFTIRIVALFIMLRYNRAYWINLSVLIVVVVICFELPLVRRIMLLAQQHGMCEGDYVFFYPTLLPATNFQSLWRDPDESDAYNEAARVAFIPLLQVTFWLARLPFKPWNSWASVEQHRELNRYLTSTLHASKVMAHFSKCPNYLNFHFSNFLSIWWFKTEVLVNIS